MFNALKRLLGAAEVDTKPAVAFEEASMNELKMINRNTLTLVKDWIDEEAMKTSCFKYGVPDFIKSELNKDIGPALTYTDLMVYLSKKHFKKINYLEIGVSVGKNFFQLLNAHTTGRFTGYDIEEINPRLQQQLQYQSRVEWDTLPKSIKKNKSSITTYDYKGMEVRYLSADVWDEKSWAKLKGEKFNMIFSDALHTPQAILFEFEMLVKYDLLDDQFIIVWDDLVGKMKNSFFKIIRKYDRVYQIKDIYFMQVNGWVGQHEAPHTVGMIANFNC
jgi:hypothetical protein